MRFVNIHPMCDECSGQLALSGIQVDLPNCCYILSCECISCGKEMTIILSMEDFIDISRTIIPPLGEGSIPDPRNN